MRRLTISTQPISTTRSPVLALSPVVSVSRTTCLAIARDALVGKGVRPLVLGMSVVPAHPEPFDAMGGIELVQPLPQIDVLHRLPVGGAPALALPAIDPLRNALL